jgi:hypothetical protein
MKLPRSKYAAQKYKNGAEIKKKTEPNLQTLEQVSVPRESFRPDDGGSKDL